MVLDLFTYGFMQKALVTGVVIAIACSLLGVFLVLKRFALIGDGLSHIAFGGVATGLLFNLTPFVGALIFSVLGSLGILRMRERSLVHGDSAIGIVSHASLGIGIFILSVASGFNVDILSYLFGSILAIRTFEMIFSIILAAIVIGGIWLFYNELFISTFDEAAAKVSGVNTKALNMLIILLTSIVIVISMRVVGLMLASSLIILPAASALQLKKHFSATLWWAAFFGVLTVVVGLVVAAAFDFAVSGTIVLANALLFLFLVLFKKLVALRRQSRA